MHATGKKRLILASSSPRRKDLLQSLGLTFKVHPSRVDESFGSLTDPSAIVEALSLRKAESVAAEWKNSERGALIIGSDTVVVCDGRILGKPSSGKEAREMLSLLQGRPHDVYSGVACVECETGNSLVGHRRTTVFMKPLEDERIHRYVATGEPDDKAGAYAIQGLGATLVEKIEGDYYNVVGLPISLLSDMLATFGVDVLD